MNEIMNRMYIKGLFLADKAKKSLKNERGDTNIISIIIILAVVIALAIVFRRQLKELFDKIWGKLQGDTDDVLADY